MLISKRVTYEFSYKGKKLNPISVEVNVPQAVLGFEDMDWISIKELDLGKSELYVVVKIDGQTAMGVNAPIVQAVANTGKVPYKIKLKLLL